MSINKVFITGNLTRDPELRSIPSGTSVLSFGVAVNDRRKNPSTGEWGDYPNYIDCTVFGARADALNKHLSKGSRVAIDGKLRWSQWEKDGQKRSKLEVIVDELEFLSQRSSGAPAPFQNDSPAPPPLSPVDAVPTAPDIIPAAPDITVYDDDIPF
ncbi:MAG: single-stranded DNA-binding protein [Coriobacteriia bacterium]|nr:single-stranded DNA-binding protein [Coriobacteriia bacterium]